MLEFTLLERHLGRKTDIWTVTCSDVHLGHVKWYAPWRRYCYFPVSGATLYDASCLSELVTFINERMAERADQRRNSE